MVAAGGMTLARRAEPLEPAGQCGSGRRSAAGGETAERGLYEEGAAGPGGREVLALAGSGRAAEAVGERQRDPALAPAARPVAAEAGEGKGVAGDAASKGLAGCENEGALGPAAGWLAGRCGQGPKRGHWRQLAGALAAGGQKAEAGWDRWPLAALAAGQTNPNRSHCPGDWECWARCSGCPGLCPSGRCSPHRSRCGCPSSPLPLRPPKGNRAC